MIETKKIIEDILLSFDREGYLVLLTPNTAHNVAEYIVTALEKNNRLQPPKGE